MNAWFSAFSRWLANVSGRAVTFFLAVGFVVVWGVTGPLFHFSDTWQLVINTATTIITFLMVFLIQNTQNRDTEAMQLKLDELIRATRGAHNTLLDLERMEDRDLKQFLEQYAALARQARQGPVDVDTGSPDVSCTPPELEGGVRRQK
ncbi:MAG: low affinity iron permease family protein [Moraxellaceae bacterium]|jgi:low affinity Fe/Cu permease|nr:low affinity iron permease family protein [Moraxellaceae bacterium]